jgi:hypothetical protein
MDPGEPTTGTRDEHYDLISVLYHALHGAESCKLYIVDAEAAGDENLASFFREAQAMHAALAEQAKGHLGIGGTTPGNMTGGDPTRRATVESGVAQGAVASGSADVRRDERLADDVPDEPPDAPPEDVSEQSAPEPPPGIRREPPPPGPPPNANPPA